MVLFDKFYLCFGGCNSQGLEEIEVRTPDINEDAVGRVIEGDKKRKALKAEPKEAEAKAKPEVAWKPQSGEVWKPMG